MLRRPLVRLDNSIELARHVVYGLLDPVDALVPARSKPMHRSALKFLDSRPSAKPCNRKSNGADQSHFGGTEKQCDGGRAQLWILRVLLEQRSPATTWLFRRLGLFR